jgi:hypothetical protein
MQAQSTEPYSYVQPGAGCRQIEYPLYLLTYEYD